LDDIPNKIKNQNGDFATTYLFVFNYALNLTTSAAQMIDQTNSTQL
jgi:hypothetical protein